ncbi:hypothetical protein BN2476_1670002 [Paraburkholderia piptadeniae]|uniref:Uncharacterized protein n=1 Tax=Paraburkholderia piptadeniae TaxID=1701573 RepID=A0A1N7SX83_9BURK|nr:hypothetical protein BN2476_1670002 [Paraburkholderia piptadeniae]
MTSCRGIRRRFALPEVREEAVEFAVDDGVALARAGFEAFAVEDADVPAAVVDEAVAVEFAGGFGDAFAAHAEHVGDQLLGDVELGGSAAVGLEQQPSAQLPAQGVMAVAGGRLGDLGEQRVHVEQHEAAHEVGAGEVLSQGVSAHAVGEAGALDLHAVGHGFAAGEHGHAGHAFAADGGDLDTAAVFHGGEQGDDGGGGEVDVMDALGGIAQQLLGAQVNEFEMWREGLPFVGRQGPEQMVAVQVGLESEHGECA